MAGVADYSVYIASLGIMGNDYTRTIEPTTSATKQAGETFVTEIGGLTAQLELGNTLNIGFRWPNYLDIPSYCSHTVVDSPKKATITCNIPIDTSPTTVVIVVDTIDNNSSV